MFLSVIYDFIGNYFGQEKPVDSFGDPIDFSPGLMVDCGIRYVQVSQNTTPKLKTTTLRLTKRGPH